MKNNILITILLLSSIALWGQNQVDTLMFSYKNEKLYILKSDNEFVVNYSIDRIKKMWEEDNIEFKSEFTWFLISNELFFKGVIITEFIKLIGEPDIYSQMIYNTIETSLNGIVRNTYLKINYDKQAEMTYFQLEG